MSTVPAPAIVVLSPHRDDAAFSAGALLETAVSAGLDVTILNIFTKSSYAPFAAATLSTEEITERRLEEDQAFLSLLNTHQGSESRLQDLSLLDAPLRLGIAVDQVTADPLSVEQMAEQVTEIRRALPDLTEIELLFVPLALGSHIDHVIARDAGRSAVRADRIGYYEDLPYASRIASAEALSRETSAILGQLQASSGAALQAYLLRAPIGSRKDKLVACYASQVAPETMEEIADWTRNLGGERVYLSSAAAIRLRKLLPANSLVTLPERSANSA